MAKKTKRSKTTKLRAAAAEIRSWVAEDQKAPNEFDRIRDVGIENFKHSATDDIKNAQLALETAQLALDKDITEMAAKLRRLQDLYENDQAYLHGVNTVLASRG